MGCEIMAKSRKRSEQETPATSTSSPTQTPGNPSNIQPTERTRTASTDTPTASAADRRASSADTRTSSPTERTSAPGPGQIRSDSDDQRRRVEQRAYELYLSRGGAHGSDWEDWLTAERELVANRSGDEPRKP
jgi:hypothetical protein